MTAKTTTFEATRDASDKQTATLIATLLGAHGTVRSRRYHCSRVYYDTFDWRVYRAGATLAHEINDDAQLIVWESFDGERLHRLASKSAPEFANDLPDGSFGHSLAKLIDVRRLLPMVAVESRGTQWNLLDSRQKTVVRVRSTSTRASSTDGTRRGKPARTVCVLPVRGFDDDARAVTELLREGLRAVPVDGTELDRALAAIGQQPASYSSKLRVQLSPDQSSDEAMKAMHRELLDIMLANEDGVRRDLDVEFLHDFRVAGRRIRSALTQVPGVFPDVPATAFKDGLAWLARFTGPLRDLDVYLLELPSYRSSLLPEDREALDPFERFLRQRRERALRSVIEALDTTRYGKLISDWRAFLDGELPADGSGLNATRPIGEIAAERITRRFRKAVKRGRAIDDGTPANVFHRLRIDCKKLRYLMEFFRSLYRVEAINPLIRELKRFQDNLGLFNDYEVQQHALRRFAREMSDERGAPVGTLLALGQLIDKLRERQLEQRRRFNERFASFSDKKNVGKYLTLFARKTTGGGSTS
ncbi:MAG: CHAD domain-containing protein [Acidobacteriota bacterium]|nr:MAG: CHAD domain-containing protein [Acidobacteriota bacterium]